MPLLNYTTKIDADKTAQEIAKCLSAHGAKAILTEYDPEENYVSAISFRIDVNDKPITFRLPCDWKPVLEIFNEDRKIPRTSRTQEQAIRTSWRIVKDWVEAQMALVETRMVTTEEVFLSYAIMRDGRTLGQTIKTNPSFLLGDGK